MKTILFAIGFVSLGFQVVMLREYLMVFSGNELIIGIFLAVWMLETGVGAYAGGYLAKKIQNVKKYAEYLFFAVSILMPAEVIAVRLIKPLLQMTLMEMVGFIPAVFSAGMLLLPVAFLFGMLFVLASKLYSNQGGQAQTALGRSYSYETLGSAFGGFFLSVVLIKYIDAVSITIILSAIILLGLAFGFSKKYFFAASICLVCLFFSGKLDKALLERQWKPFNLEESVESAYGRIAVVGLGEGEYDFYENNSKIYSTVTGIHNEEIVHYAMLLVENPKRVLLIGGGPNNIIETKKYKPELITYVELDGSLVGLLKKYYKDKTVFDSVDVKIADARTFVKNNFKSRQKYHCIIMDLPLPVSAATNRYYTAEFFAMLEKAVSKGGVIIFALGSSENYMPDSMKKLTKTVFYSAGEYIVIPGTRNYYLYSCGKRGTDDAEAMPLTTMRETFSVIPEKIIEGMEKKKIKTTYLTSNQIKYELSEFRINRLKNWIKEGEKVPANYDNRPTTYLYGIAHWLSYFSVSIQPGFFKESLAIRASGDYLFVAVIAAFIFLISRHFIRKQKEYFLMALVSFSGILVELMLIYQYQVRYGCLYGQIGLLFALSLLGISAGSYVYSRHFFGKQLNLRQAVVLFGLFCVFLQHGYIQATSFILSNQYAYFVVMFSGGFFTGYIFSLLGKSVSKNSFEYAKSAGKLYGCDLFGTMLGSLVTGTVMLPFFGAGAACAITGIVLIVAAFL